MADRKGLGNAVGAFLLATARQGTCMVPILYVLAHFFGEYGIASVQAAADVLSLVFAIPISVSMMKKIRKQTQIQPAEEEAAGSLPETQQV